MLIKSDRRSDGFNCLDLLNQKNPRKTEAPKLAQITDISFYAAKRNKRFSRLTCFASKKIK